MKITWHGHAFFAVETRQGTRILIDPFVENGLTQKTVQDFQPDLILVGHAHDDHVGSTLEFDAPVVANFEIATYLERQGARETTGMNTGGFYRGIPGVRIWMAPALHSSGFHTDEGPMGYGGCANGFLIDDGETKFYHSGDTGLFGDMRTVIRDIMRPDIAAIPIGDLFTMGPEHAAHAVEWLGVSAVVPMHYVPAKTSEYAQRWTEIRGEPPAPYFPPITVDPGAFVSAVGDRASVLLPIADEPFEVSGRRIVKPPHLGAGIKRPA